MKSQLVSTLVLAAATTLAYAALPEFSALDKDGDGMINRDEASMHDGLTAVFSKADIDADGLLSPAEYDAIK